MMDVAVAESVDTRTGSISRSAAVTTTLLRARALGPLFAGYAFPFALVLYLAFEGGGYDAVVRGEMGLIAWWSILMLGILGLLPRVRMSATAWALVAVFVGLVAWTTAGVGWSESAERSVTEAARVASLLGVFGLSLFIHGKAGLRRVLIALAGAISLIAGAALLSRLQPSLISTGDATNLLPDTRARLNFPLDYWNALATLIAMGLPLLVWSAGSARNLAGRAVAAGALPMLALAAYYTLSRGGAVEIVLALIVLVTLHPRRLALLPVLLVGGGGAGILIAGALQRSALADNAGSALAASQGNEMLVMAIVVMVGCGLLITALGLAERHGVGPRLAISRRQAALGSAGAATLAVVLFLALGGPHALSDGWTEFKSPVGPADGTERFESASGNGRYQWWQAAVSANATDPLLGIGPGTFEYYWAAEGDRPGFVRDAHSLYLETLAELGVVGLILVLTLVGGGIAVAVKRTLNRDDSERSSMLAAATAAMAAFAASAAIDWSWEMTVLPVIFFLLLASVLRSDDDGVNRKVMPLGPRTVVAVVALIAAALVLIPLSATEAVRASQDSFTAGNLDKALEHAQRAEDLQPYAASPFLQEALVLEQQDDITAARTAAALATEKEPTNWRTWLVLSRLDAKAGESGDAVRSYREARALNPRSPLFADE